jgi:adenosylhomocysteine nucleosidase
MGWLIVTPLQEELDLLLRSFSRRGVAAESADTDRLPLTRLPALNITLARGGVGKAQFAVQTQHLLDVGGAWDLVLCAGAAGAIGEGVTIGDVVVGTVTVEHDYNNKFSTQPSPRFDGSPDAIAGLCAVGSLLDAYSVHFGPIASGDEDVVDADRGRVLHLTTGALAVAWEGAGGARACRFSGVPFVEIRGVTDAADRHAPSDFETNLEVAMHNVATLITLWATQ